MLASATVLAQAPLAQTPPAPVVSTNAALPPKLTGIAHVAIRVANLDASRAFYAKLGYAQPFTLTGKNGEVTEAFIKIDDRQYIELYPGDAAHAPAFLHVCFEAQNLPGLYPTYTANGIVAPPVKKAGAGNLLMAWKGPEDQTEEITEYQPGSRHSNDFGKDLGADRVSTHMVGAVVPMQDPKAAAQYFMQRMNFTNSGTREGAVLTSPPGLHDAYFGFRSSSAPERLALIFQVASAKSTLLRLQQLGIEATVRNERVLTHDPDGNLLVFTSEKL
ncbi:VOC family protein [Terriglobus aquaticus]|uniref:VOC family protein n=1 Tax=Terriglobus aquaticus TaxID=940139 RepID=A0ABW9KQW9_9BACT|nr:VOC family protein [Terriglobus aquaticus]